MSKKLAILLALGSGFRVQSLASILSKDIKMTNNRVQIRKRSKPGVPQPTAVFPFFKVKKSLCFALIEPDSSPEDYERQKK